MIYRLSAGDHHLDPYRHVAEPQWLEARRLFVAESRLVVERLLSEPRYEIESVAVTPSAYESLAPKLATASCDVLICERDLLQNITGFNFHRGCLALVHRPDDWGVENVLRGRRLVALEAVGNPDNIGGIFRTAAALGGDGILLDADCGDPYYRKAIRTSMAATLQLPWVRVEQWLVMLERIRREGFTLMALTPHETAMPLGEFSSGARSADRIAILLGREGQGLTEAACEIADVRVRIPIQPAVDSLNVVVAAGIALDRLR